MRRTAAAAAFLVALLALAPVAGADDGRHNDDDHGSAVAQVGPLDLTGTLKGAPYEIRVPADWNGTLVVYAHGYRDKADHPGEIDDRSASAFVAEPFEETMLAAGYAIAGSAYSDNGWAVKEGIRDTKRLTDYFREHVAKPDTTILVGWSMGSVITFESIEIHKGTYDGAIPGCAVGAGAARAFDGTLALSSAYDAVYGWPAAWGNPADVRDDLDFESEVAPVVFAQLLGDPAGPAKFEFMRRVSGVPSGPEWPGSLWFFTTEGRAELERRAGGPVAQNLDHTYSLTSTDRAVLNTMGMPDSDIDGYLAAMNGTKYDSPAESRKYIEKYATYTGKLKRPVLTTHTMVDALVPPAHISAYTETVAAAGRSENLASLWTDGIGHCSFTPTQMLTAVQTMERWIGTGDRPDTSSLVGTDGFIDFTPPAWPQPLGLKLHTHDDHGS